jgi:antitoxin VapB
LHKTASSSVIHIPTHVPRFESLRFNPRYAVWHAIKQELLSRAKRSKARVFMNGRSQHVRIPAEYRFTTSEFYLRRDARTGDVILSRVPESWAEIYAALGSAGVPDDFLSDRAQGTSEKREEL